MFAPKAQCLLVAAARFGVVRLTVCKISQSVERPRAYQTVGCFGHVEKVCQPFATFREMSSHVPVPPQGCSEAQSAGCVAARFQPMQCRSRICLLDLELLQPP